MIVRHKQTGIEYKVKKDCGEILVCFVEPFLTRWDTLVEICILSRENVDVIESESQLKIF